MATVNLSALVWNTAKKQPVEISVDETLAVKLVEEVFSDLNRHGAIKAYGEKPSPYQLTQHYCRTCAFSRLLEGHKHLLRAVIIG